MTREKALIYIIPAIKRTWNDKICNEIMEVLEQEPCGDAISLEVVIEWLKDKDIIKLSSQEETARKELKALTPVMAEPKTGHWQHYEGMLICSECGTEFYDDIMEYCGDDVPKWCPNCGCRMVEPQETQQSDHKCHTCKHYTSGEHDGSCGSYICKEYSNWESED